MNETDPPPGMGQAAFMLMFALVSRMKAKGLLTDEDVRVMVDEATLGLEEQGLLVHPDIKGAHLLMEMLLHASLGLGPPPSISEP